MKNDKKYNRKYYLRRKGTQQGWLTVREICELKGVSVFWIRKNIGVKIKAYSHLTKIKYEKDLIKWN